jgi:hypothetical protein
MATPRNDRPSTPHATAWICAAIVAAGALAGTTLSNIGCVFSGPEPSKCTVTPAGGLLSIVAVIALPGCLLVATYLWRRPIPTGWLIAATVTLTVAGFVGNIALWGLVKG